MKRLTISIVLSALFAANLGAVEVAEPNDAGSELKFPASMTRKSWIFAVKDEKGETLLYDDPGPVKPMYVAKLIMERDYPRSTTPKGVLAEIEKSPLAKKLSKAQQAFIEAGYAVWVDADDTLLPNYSPTWLYAVSEADARLMAQACLDGLARRADERVLEYKRNLAERKEQLDQATRELPKKEAELKACEDQYQSVKQARHEFESDDEAGKSAMQTIAEMDKTLDTLEIELAGIRKKLGAINEYRKTPQSMQDHDRLRKLPDGMLVKLEQMFIEQTIELSGLEARREVAELIRAREQRFLGLASERSQLQRDVRDLKKSVDECTWWIADIRERLDHPTIEMLAPKVYNNSVTIYRIEGAYTPEELKEQERKRREHQDELKRRLEMEQKLRMQQESKNK
jgi:hypothetical protein